MKKYQELAIQYSDEIAKIKRHQEQEQAALDALNKFNPSGDWDNYDFEGRGKLEETWENARTSLMIEYDKLSQDIEAEYWDVPFAKPRKQGIEKFFELAGI